MIARSKKCAVSVLTLGLLLSCLTGPARADDSLYFPNGVNVVLSVDVAGLLKSKMFEELKKQSPMIAGFIEDPKGANDAFGIPITNISRMTVGTVAPFEQYMVITTMKPVTAASIKAAKKPRGYQLDYAFAETKVGAFAVYVEKFRFKVKPGDKPGPLESGTAFCVVGEKTVLVGDQGLDDGLRKILERNKKPAMFPGFEKMLEVGSASSMSVVVDVQGFSAKLKSDFAKEMGRTFPGLPGVADEIQIVAIRANVAGDFKATGTVLCKSEAGAAEGKKVAAAGIANLKSKLPKDDPKMPASMRALLKGTHTALDAIKLSTKGGTVEAELTLDLTTAVQFVRAFFEVNAAIPDAPPVPDVKEKSSSAPEKSK